MPDENEPPSGSDDIDNLEEIPEDLVMEWEAPRGAWPEHQRLRLRGEVRRALDRLLRRGRETLPYYLWFIAEHANDRLSPGQMQNLRARREVLYAHHFLQDAWDLERVLGVDAAAAALQNPHCLMQVHLEDVRAAFLYILEYPEGYQPLDIERE